jgi:hypothetical protein
LFLGFGFFPLTVIIPDTGLTRQYQSIRLNPGSSAARQRRPLRIDRVAQPESVGQERGPKKRRPTGELGHRPCPGKRVCGDQQRVSANHCPRCSSEPSLKIRASNMRPGPPGRVPYRTSILVMSRSWTRWCAWRSHARLCRGCSGKLPRRFATRREASAVLAVASEYRCLAHRAPGEPILIEG